MARERTQDTERRHATILFADITGFTALNERLDPEEAYAIVSRCLKMLDEIARQHGGTVDKYLGDCIMAMFGVPFAIENAPRAAVNAAIEMHNRIHDFVHENRLAEPIDIHTGINSGLVVSGDVSGPVIREFSVMGDAVNIAARLKDLAPKGEIWVGHETYRYTRDDFDYEPLDPLPLKGKQERVPICRVRSRQLALEHRPLEARQQVASPLVGREAELSQLREALRATSKNGAGRVVGVAGAAGMGKSRLLAELRTTDEAQGVQWLHGRCLSIGSKLSFHPFSDLLRSWLGIRDDQDEAAALALLESRLRDLFSGDPEDLMPFIARLMGLNRAPSRRRPEEISGEAMEKLLLRAMNELLGRLATSGPLVVSFEDLHWGDTSSIELLGSLLRMAASRPVVFLLLFRPDDPSGSVAQIEKAMAAVPSALCSEIRLEPLDRGSADELVENLFQGGDVPRATRSLIEDRAAGNPFYIEEVVRALLDEGALELRDGRLWATERIDRVSIPGTIHEVIMARVDHLELDTKSLLQAAAVIGRGCYHRVLAHVMDDDRLDDHLQKLRDGCFLVPRERRGETVYEFHHPLIRDVVYQGVSLGRRRALHLRIADAIEAELSEAHPGFYGMLAYHFGLGQDLTRAERYLLLAGDEAGKLAASSETLHYLLEASRLYFEVHGEEPDAEKQALVEQKLALAFFNRGKMAEGDEHFDRALQLLGQRVPVTRLGRTLHYGVAVASVLADLYLRRRRQRAPATERDRGVIDLMFRGAKAQTTANPTGFFFDTMLGLRRLNRVDPTTVERSGGIYAAVVGFLSYAGFPVGIGDRLLARAEALVSGDDVRELYLLRVFQFIHRLFQGDWDDRYAVEDALTEENLQLGELWNVINYLPLDAKRRIHQGRFAEAAERLESIAKIEELYAYDLAGSNRCAVAMFLHLERRRLPEALRAARAYYQGYNEELLNLLALGNQAKIELLLGDMDAARSSVEKAEQIVRRSSFVPPFHLGDTLLARLALDLERVERARADGTRAPRGAIRSARRAARRALATSRKVAWQRPEAGLLAGRLAWISGRRGKALALWRSALLEAERLRMRPAAGRIYLEAGRRLAGTSHTFERLDAEGCFGRAARAFSELELAWDLGQLESARRAASAPVT